MKWIDTSNILKSARSMEKRCFQKSNQSLFQVSLNKEETAISLTWFIKVRILTCMAPRVKVSHSVMSESLQPHGLYSPWHSPGQNTGVGSLSLLQGIFPTQGLNPGLLLFKVTLIPSSNSCQYLSTQYGPNALVSKQLYEVGLYFIEDD